MAGDNAAREGKENPKGRRRKKARWVVRILRLLLTAAAIYALFTYVIGVAVVRGDSMWPSIPNGSVVLFARIGVSYDAGDVICARVDGRTVMKRIIAEAGDAVAFDADGGALLVNGLAEGRYGAVGKTLSRGEAETVVSDQCVYVLGDHREQSTDSRDFGEIPVSLIDGKVFFLFRGL